MARNGRTWGSVFCNMSSPRIPDRIKSRFFLCTFANGLPPLRASSLCSPKSSVDGNYHLVGPTTTQRLFFFFCGVGQATQKNTMRHRFARNFVRESDRYLEGSKCNRVARAIIACTIVLLVNTRCKKIYACTYVDVGIGRQSTEFDGAPESHYEGRTSSYIH